MRKALVCAMLSIGLAAFADTGYFTMVIGGGLADGTYLGEGVGGNEFESGMGWFAEFASGEVPGFGFDLGITSYESDNYVGSSVVTGKTTLLYADLLYYVARVKLGPRARAHFFLSAGGDFGSVKYMDSYDHPMLGGVDRLLGLAAGAGARLFLGSGFYVGATVKPMVISGNDLGQTFGLRILGGAGFGL